MPLSRIMPGLLQVRFHLFWYNYGSITQEYWCLLHLLLRHKQGRADEVSTAQKDEGQVEGAATKLGIQELRQHHRKSMLLRRKQAGPWTFSSSTAGWVFHLLWWPAQSQVYKHLGSSSIALPLWGYAAAVRKSPCGGAQAQSSYLLFCIALY